MNLYNNNPNFSIVMPGGCNAHCDFCFNGGNTGNVDNAYAYLNILDNIFRRIDPEFKQISITGGEPLLSPQLIDVLYLIKHHKKRFPKVVMTTNGTGLFDKLVDLQGVVDHINISRHHYSYKKNKDIFGGSYDISDGIMSQIIRKAGFYGIDVSVNCVIKDDTNSDFIRSFINWSAGLRFKTINFRKESGSLLPTVAEESYSLHTTISEGACPVCRVKEQIIEGMPIMWKASIPEPVDVIDSIYEVVYQPDGKLYADWSKKQLVDIAYFNPFVAPENPADRGIYQSNDHDGQQSCGSSGCGSREIPSRGCHMSSRFGRGC